MKDLGNVKRILVVDIMNDRKKSELLLSQQGYLRKVVGWFRMKDSKVAVTPLGHHTKMTVK